MRVKQLAEYVGASPDTIRYYTKLGLLKPHREGRNGYYCYEENDRRRLQFILNARELGLPVEVIDRLLSCADRKRARCPEARRLIEQTLETAQVRLETLQVFCQCLQQAAAEWGEAPRGADVNTLIENCGGGRPPLAGGK